jgi:hypothetical protein
VSGKRFPSSGSGQASHEKYYNKKALKNQSFFMCPGRDSNSHDFSPPPQGGASASFATRTLKRLQS